LTTSTLDQALALAYNAWRVFPVFSIRSDGTCSCGGRPNCSPGKHPIPNRGLTEASYDDEQVRAWWAKHPDANIGLATGPQSGVWVLDIDTDKGGDVSLVQLETEVGDLTPALSSRTGSGGRHLFYAYPRDDEEQLLISNRTGLLPGLDVRGEGGYVVLPPSNHHSGGSYTWEGGPDLRRMELAEASRALTERVVKASRQSRAVAGQFGDDEEPIPDGARDDTLTRMAGAMRRQAMSEKEMLAALMVVNEERCDPPMPESQVEKIAKSVASYAPEVASARLTAADLPDDLLPMPPLKGEPFPEHLLEVDGLLGQLCVWINTITPRRQPVGALATSLGALGALYGRRVRTLTNLRTNLYAIVLADSGVGKDGARRCIQSAFEDAGIGDMVGGDSWKSGQGILTSLQRKPSLVFLMDEFGDTLKAATGRNAKEHHQKIVQVLKQLYSAAGGTMNPSEGASAEDRGEKLLWPHACLVGMSTPGAFYEGLQRAQLEDGLGNRFLVFPLDSYPEVNARANPDVPTDIREALIEHDEQTRGSGNLAALDPRFGGCRVMDLAPEADKLLTALECDIGARRGEDDWHDGAIPALWRRVPENAQKLALIRSVSRSPGATEIPVDLVRWGVEVSSWCVRSLEGQLYHWLADSDFEAAMQKVRRTLARHPEKLWSRRDLTRAAHVYGMVFDSVVREIIGSEVVLVGKKYKGIIK